MGNLFFPKLCGICIYGLLMVSTKPESRTIQIGLKMLKSEEETNFGRFMAGVILVIIPSLIILFLGQKQLQKGLTSGATKE